MPDHLANSTRIYESGIAEILFDIMASFRPITVVLLQQLSIYDPRQSDVYNQINYGVVTCCTFIITIKLI